MPAQRVFDFLLSLVGLIILSPLLLAVVGLVRVLGGPGGAFFTQTRIGLAGRPFRIWKFRTMKMEHGLPLTAGQDPRITRIGRFLRATKIDELPQLWNVLRGEMGFVGPRPEVARYVEHYSPSQREVLRLRPGITDPASFAFYDEADLLGRVDNPESYYVNVLLGEKIRINLEYARRRSLATDLVLIIATVLRPMGIRLNVFRWLGLRPPSLEMAGSVH
jgi:lipopolysaccharide/colanic/teichoic acid biosynthesis glycosyltransferase